MVWSPNKTAQNRSSVMSVWQVILAHFGSLFWPTLRVEVLGSGVWSGLAYYKDQLSKLWECGKSRCLCGFPRTVERVGSRFWLSRLSTVRHFHSSFRLCRFFSFRLPLVTFAGSDMTLFPSR